MYVLSESVILSTSPVSVYHSLLVPELNSLFGGRVSSIVVMEDTKLFQVIDEATKLGKFGDNFKLVSLIPSNVHGEDHFASEVVFAEVKLQNGSSEKSVHVVIKRQQHIEFIREMMNTDAQFYNEVLMYNEILPFLDINGIVSDIFPKCIYGKATKGGNYEDDIVVVEDLRKDGYRLTKEKIFLDLEHCVLVLKKIARFHALSYAKKQENFEEFYKLVNKLKEMRYVDQSKDEINNFWGMTIFRGVENLENETNEYKTNLEKMKKTFEDPYKMMKNFCQPEEPVAVLCHGDFCRNNMVFRYDSDEKPVEVRFFDVATARYTSPAIDLAFFLLMNTSADLRRDHWDDFFEIYYESLSTEIIPKCNVPSLEDIKREVRTKALYGYTLCSFFIPMMMDEKKKDIESLASMKPEDMESLAKSRGGEIVTTVLTDIVRDLARLDCV